METKLSNKITMIKTTSSYMAEHHDVWSTMTRLQTAMTEVNAQLAEIDAGALKHQILVGATADKADAREALEEKTFPMCEALSVLAHDAGDNDLRALTRITRTLLDRNTGEELSTLATAVLAQANARKTELATLHVSQANIDELSSALTEFNETKAGPRTATAERAALTESLPRRVKATIDILTNTVDPLVNLFSRTDPDFVAGYLNARAIVDRAATHKTKEIVSPAPA